MFPEQARWGCKGIVVVYLVERISILVLGVVAFANWAN